MIRRAIGFLIILALTLWCLERLADFLFSKNTNVKSVYVQQKQISAEVVALGSSNVLYGFSPKVFEQETGCKAYNLASNHASFTENLAAFYLYLKHNKQPRYLLIGLNAPDLTLSGSAFHAYLFLPFDEDRFIHSLILREVADYDAWSFIPFMKYARYNEFTNPILLQGLYKWIHGGAPYYPDGFFRVPDDGKEFRSYETFKKEYPAGVKCQWGQAQSQDLAALLRFATGKGIKVVVYETPFLEESKKFFQGRDSVNKEIAGIAKREGAEFMTFDSLDLCRDRKNFVSAFHLKGAQSLIFTKVMAERLKKISPSFCKEAR